MARFLAVDGVLLPVEPVMVDWRYGWILAPAGDEHGLNFTVHPRLVRIASGSLFLFHRV